MLNLDIIYHLLINLIRRATNCKAIIGVSRLAALLDCPRIPSFTTPQNGVVKMSIQAMTTVFILTAMFCISPPLFARPIVADLAIRSVDIDHDFDGIDILLFGARNDVGRIVIVLKGSDHHYIVRKKEKIAGLIWMNRKSVEFDNVNSFYAMATTNNLDEIRNDNLLQQLEIGVDNLNIEAIPEHRSIKSKATISEFKEALKRYKTQQGLYKSEIEPVSFWGETLFRTNLKFPQNIERGWYTAEVYLFDDGKLSAVQTTPIYVGKTGFEAFMFDIAHENRLLYGILCVFMAISAGWLASKIIGKH